MLQAIRGPVCTNKCIINAFLPMGIIARQFEGNTVRLARLRAICAPCVHARGMFQLLLPFGTGTSDTTGTTAPVVHFNFGTSAQLENPPVAHFTRS